MKTFSAPVVRLLASTLVIVLGRSAVIPFMAIYLHDHLQITQEQVGLMLGASTLTATVFGLCAGHFADRLDKGKLIAGVTGVIALASVAITLLHSVAATVLMLASIDAAVSLRGISIKASLAELLPPDQRAKAFSMNYTLVNVAFALGPMVGALVVGMNASYPFWIASGFAALSMQIVPRNIGGKRAEGVAAAKGASGWRATWEALRLDRRLQLFTLGCLLSAFAYSRYSAYLAQYLMATQGSAIAYRWIPHLVMTNAITVVVLQYPLGRIMRREHLMRWIGVGSLMFVLALFGFIFAVSLSAWIAVMVVFTIGEVIVVPAEYMFIDLIAPDGKKGSYYGVQSLSDLGSAISQAACGIVLSHAPAAAMFVMLAIATTLGALLYHAGARAEARPALNASPAQA